MFRNKAFYGVYRPGETLDDFPMAASDSLNEDQLSISTFPHLQLARQPGNSTCSTPYSHYTSCASTSSPQTPLSSRNLRSR